MPENKHWHNPLPRTVRGKRRMAARGGKHPRTTPQFYSGKATKKAILPQKTGPARA